MNPYELVIWDQLIATFHVASKRASIATIEAIAAATGVSSLGGMPVAEYHDRHKRRETEELIADFADTNPSVATQVKALLDQLDAEKEVESRCR